MNLVGRNAPRTVAALVLGVGLSLGGAACGSGSTGDFTSYSGGGPAGVTPVHSGGSSSSSSGSSGGGSGSGGSNGGSTSSSSGGSSGGADAGFNNENTTSFTLINTSITTVQAGASVYGFDPIKYGATIDLALVGDQLSIRADPPSSMAAVGSIAFSLDATYTYTANTAPYSLCGQDGPGQFKPCMLSPGKHTLTVTTYPLQDLGGTPYTPTTFSFTVVDSNAPDGGDDGGTD